MRTETLKSVRVAAFILFAVASIIVVSYKPGSFLALLVPATPLIVGVVASSVISIRQGWTVAKRAEWFEKTLGRTGEDRR